MLDFLLEISSIGKSPPSSDDQQSFFNFSEEKRCYRDKPLYKDEN